MAFLLPVNQATHLNNCPLPCDCASDWACVCVILMADLLAVLVRSLATPQTPCAITTQATDRVAVHSGCRADNKPKPTICVTSPTVSMRAMPKRVASQPPSKLANTPAASYSKNKKANVKGE